MPAVTRPWARTVSEVLQEANLSLNGLTVPQSERYLAESGPNSLTVRDHEPWYMLFLHQFANPLVYMLIGAAGVKAYFKGPVDAAVISAVLLFMAVIGFVQEMKARKAMAALLTLSAPKAKIRREGRTSLIDAAQVVPGDILVLEAGDRVAADARLLELANLKINESTFSGESLPVEKDVHAIAADAPLHDRKNMVFMGTTVSHGRALAVVTATGMETEIGRIATAMSGVKKEKTPLEKSIEQLGRSLIWIVTGACIVLSVAALLHSMDWVDVMLLAVAAAVSGIPEGLPAAVTVVLAICVNRMAMRNVLIRKLAAVETLGATTIICSDKTGTLTLNQMTVRNVWAGKRLLRLPVAAMNPRANSGITVSLLIPVMMIS